MEEEVDERKSSMEREEVLNCGGAVMAVAGK